MTDTPFLPVLNMSRNHDASVIPEGAKRIDRKTYYGNPWKIGAPHPDHGWPMSRDEACDLFEQRTLPALDLRGLRDATALLCWCAPKRCHGDAIARKLQQEARHGR